MAEEVSRFGGSKLRLEHLIEVPSDHLKKFPNPRQLFLKFRCI